MSLAKLFGLKSNYQFQTTRFLSLGSTSCNPFRGKLPDPIFKTKVARRANRKLKYDKYKEVIIAQRQRKPWEFIVQPDQRASWKHKKWMDPYLRRWVSKLPEPIEDKVLGLHYREQRKPLQNCENVQELFTLMLDDHKGLKFVIPTFDQHFPQLNSSYFHQYLTHTKYVHGLPHQLEFGEVDEKQFEHFVDFVEQLLVFQYNSKLCFNEIEDVYEKKTKMDSELMKSIVNYLSTTRLSSDVSLSYNTENSMFWIRGRGFIKKYMPEDISRSYQTHDQQLIQVTSSDRLPCFSDFTGDLSNTGNIPYYNFSPYLFGHEEKFYRNLISAGQRSYAGDSDVNYQEAYEERKLQELPPPKYNNNYFGHTQVCLLPSTYSREWYNDNLEHGDITSEIEEHLKSYGIMSGWTWTAGQASYAGHYMDNDVTEPWCSNVILFDGRHLSFFGYQLNTLAIDEDNVHEHTRRNLCFGKTSVPLFEEVTDEGVNGLNVEALKILFKMLSKQQSVAQNSEEIADYERNLQVQEVDLENPDLEDQKPLHVRLQEEEEQRLELIEEERKKEEWEAKSLPAKAKHYGSSSVQKIKSIVGRS